MCFAWLLLFYNSCFSVHDIKTCRQVLNVVYTYTLYCINFVVSLIVRRNAVDACCFFNLYSSSGCNIKAVNTINVSYILIVYAYFNVLSFSRSNIYLCAGKGREACCEVGYFCYNVFLNINITCVYTAKIESYIVFSDICFAKVYLYNVFVVKCFSIIICRAGVSRLVQNIVNINITNVTTVVPTPIEGVVTVLELDFVITFGQCYVRTVRTLE